ACAHRFVKDNSARGTCLVLDEALDLQYQFDPCGKYSHDHFMKDFGLCQAGMSAAVGKDDAFVMGAPGSVFWQGAIFLTNITEEMGVPTTEIVSPYKDYETPTAFYSYNGYAVAMGRFDDSKALYYVSGAPKSRITGEIVFFTEYVKGKLEYHQNKIVKGHLDFSGFGSSLLSLDLNNDDYDDLIVGAPYYYNRNVGGAIYIYYGGKIMINNASKPVEILSRSMSDLECQQLKCEHAQFGFSLTKLGDINQDGFQDFAVGAPYEGNGAVYIYHGSSSSIDRYVQRIEASSLTGFNLSSFGYSLSGGFDLDANGYSDLLVGAYESDTVALLRSRPIIKIKPTFSVKPEAVNLDVTPRTCEARPEIKDKLCVAVKMCLKFSTTPTTGNVFPSVTYKLEAEPQRRLSRVELLDAQDSSKRIIENKTVVLLQNNDTCVTEVALLKDQFDDRLNPIELRFTFGLATDKKNAEEYPQSAVQDINFFPVLDTEDSKDKSNVVSFEVDFVKECGDDKRCDSNLQFTAELIDLKKNTAGVHEMLVSQKNELQIEMRITNQGEPAYLTRVYVVKPKSVTYFGTQTEDLVACQTVKDNDTLIMCDQIGNPLKDRNVYFVLKLNVPLNMSVTGEVYKIQAWINTSSTEKTPENDHHILQFQVLNRADITVDTNVAPDYPILCQGEPREVQDIIDDSHIGASVKHNFIVRNIGPGEIAESEITISWPYQLAQAKGKKKYLLYLMKKPQLDGKVLECTDIEKYINPENIKPKDQAKSGALTEPASGVSSGNQRRKRQADREVKSSGKVVVMSCHETDNVECFQFKCRIGKLEPNQDFAKITFEARLWESSLLSDYLQAPDVQIISWANVTIPERLKITQDKTNDEKGAITRTVPNFKEASGQTVQWWIILVAVLIGLIVLLVVIFVLYKLGFFRRKRMEDMKMYKAEKKQQAMLEDYDNKEN
ncbi:hypothetical protein Btru_034367, partial [Bulinus truncatus]